MQALTPSLLSLQQLANIAQFECPADKITTDVFLQQGDNYDFQ